MDEARAADTDVPDPGDLDVSVVLPVFNRERQFQDELDRIRAGLEASPYSFEIIVVDDGSNDGSGACSREIEGIRLIQFDRATAAPGPARRGRDRSRAWAGRGLDRRRPDVPEPRDPAPGRRARGLGPGRRRPARHRRAPPRSRAVDGPVVDPPAGQLPRRDADPRPHSAMRAFRANVARQYLHLLPTGPSTSRPSRWRSSPTATR